MNVRLNSLRTIIFYFLYFLLLRNGWFRAVLRLTDSLFFIIKFFLCSGEGRLLSEQFQTCYLIYFFQIIREVKGEGI